MENDEPPAPEVRHDVSPAKRDPPLDEQVIAADIDARVAQQMEKYLMEMGAIKKY